jgi:hypothetical protein
MSTKIKLLMCLATWAAASSWAAGKAFADEPAFYQVRIRSAESNLAENEVQKLRLTGFAERLRIELMVDNLGEANIGCDRCGELVADEKVEGLGPPNRPLTSLLFSLPRNGSQLEAFARSYDFIQASELGTRFFTMEIDGTPPPSSACNASQISLGCKTRQLCVQTGGCDKPYGGPCNLCPTQ